MLHPQRIGHLVELVSVLVIGLMGKGARILVNHAATGVDDNPLEVFPSMLVPYPLPFLSRPAGCKERAGPTD